MTSFEKFIKEIKSCNTHSIPINFWWRDDDLVSDSDQFVKICDISNNLSTPLLCSIIPRLISNGLKLDGENTSLVSYCQHGWAHINHEPDGELKSEFGPHRSSLDVKVDIQEGVNALKKKVGQKLLPIFVPPWNRFDSCHIEVLIELGFQYLSSYGLLEYPQTQADIHPINTHIDVIYWGKDGVHMRKLDEIYSTLTELLKQYQLNYKKIKNPEAIGILSHHRVMNRDDLESLAQLISSIQSIPGTSFIQPFLK